MSGQQNNSTKGIMEKFLVAGLTITKAMPWVMPTLGGFMSWGSLPSGLSLYTNLIAIVGGVAVGMRGNKLIADKGVGFIGALTTSVVAAIAIASAQPIEQFIKASNNGAKESGAAFKKGVLANIGNFIIGAISGDESSTKQGQPSYVVSGLLEGSECRGNKEVFDNSYCNGVLKPQKTPDNTPFVVRYYNVDGKVYPYVTFQVKDNNRTIECSAYRSRNELMKLCGSQNVP